MRHLAIILLIGAFMRHGMAGWLAENSELSKAAWFYVLGGAWEFLLCALLLWVIYGYRHTLWRGLASTALIIGMIEGLQMPVCRLAIDDIRAVPNGANLCDVVTGLPVGAVLFALYLLIVCYEIGKALRKG